MQFPDALTVRSLEDSFSPDWSNVSVFEKDCIYEIKAEAVAVVA